MTSHAPQEEPTAAERGQHTTVIFDFKADRFPVFWAEWATEGGTFTHIDLSDGSAEPYDPLRMSRAHWSMD